VKHDPQQAERVAHCDESAESGRPDKHISACCSMLRQRRLSEGTLKLRTHVFMMEHELGMPVVPKL
jgi:hypothetical protein